eukprot:TRINITY_DN7199_c0_g1_i1.p1 TRINITY_DN7199_c0_g1~~TRINITY_DN7199_c0_g1_i1.p1  ORF type:complete len:173 (+),score=29.25 TRINITY_DN7199_c0_g1_i1:104-622(+)
MLKIVFLFALLFVGATHALVRDTPLTLTSACRYKPWTQWSACDAICGGGNMTRKAAALDRNTCDDQVQYKSCNTFKCSCVLGDWSPWSECILLPGHKCAKFQHRSRKVIKSDPLCDKMHEINFCPVEITFRGPCSGTSISTKSIVCLGGCFSSQINRFLTAEQQADIFDEIF